MNINKQKNIKSIGEMKLYYRHTILRKMNSIKSMVMIPIDNAMMYLEISRMKKD